MESGLEAENLSAANAIRNGFEVDIPGSNQMV